MLEPPGFATAELGDVEVVVHDGRLHLFHLCVPGHDRIAHWVSDDGVEWQACPDALKTGDPGAFDDDQLWTMSVTRTDDRFVMLYTALSTGDAGRVQRICRATSDDLERWSKDALPVAIASGENYETEPGRSAPWVSFRDPKPLRVDGGYVVAVCAQVPSGPPHRRGAVALLRSEDLQAFTLEQPLYAPRREFELECPQLVADAHGFILLASMQDDRSVRWFRATKLAGAYRTPPDNRLLPVPYYAARIFEFDEGLGIVGMYCYRDRAGGEHRVMPSPLRLDTSWPDRMLLRPWPATFQRFAAASEPLETKTPCFDNPTATRSHNGLIVVAGEELWTGTRHYRHALVAGTLRCDAPRFGLAFDVSEQGAGWFVELEPTAHRARLCFRGPSADASGQPWFERELVQTARWNESGPGPLQIRLRLAGRAVELTVGGAVVLSAVVDRSAVDPGPLGVWADSGRMRAELRVHGLRA